MIDVKKYCFSAHKSKKCATDCIFILLYLLYNVKNSFLCTANLKSIFVFINLNSKVMSEVAEKVKDIIVDKLNVEKSEVTNEASFTNDLGADSLDTVELIMEFEKEFDIQIPDDQAEKITNVGEAVAYIEEAVAKK